MKHKTWKSAWLILCGVLLLSIVQVGTPTPAAAILYSSIWSGSNNIQLTDPVNPTSGEPSTGGQDIAKIWYAYTGGYNYFRMDLRTAPASGNYASSYGFYIDKPVGGATITTHDYVNQVVVGLPLIDFILRVDTTDGTNYTAKFQQWSGTAWVDRTSAVGTTSGKDGLTLEWRISDSYFKASDLFQIYGATFNPRTGSNDATKYDITSALVTPIPNAAWLLGSGIIGLIGLKRRRAKKAK